MPIRPIQLVWFSSGQNWHSGTCQFPSNPSFQDITPVITVFAWVRCGGEICKIAVLEVFLEARARAHSFWILLIATSFRELQPTHWNVASAIKAASRESLPSNYCAGIRHGTNVFSPPGYLRVCIDTIWWVPDTFGNRKKITLNFCFFRALNLCQTFAAQLKFWCTAPRIYAHPSLLLFIILPCPKI